LQLTMPNPMRSSRLVGQMEVQSCAPQGRPIQQKSSWETEATSIAEARTYDTHPGKWSSAEA